MKISEAIDLCAVEANRTWSAVVVFSWIGFGAALYFLAAQAGLLEFTYHPNELGVISPTTIARIPKAARMFHFVAGITFSATVGVLGWCIWLGFCTFLTTRGNRDARKVFSMDAWANLVLLVVLADIFYKFVPYVVAIALGIVMLLAYRLAFYLHVGKDRPDSD